ncbi:MAG: DUF1559 domain-containing protein [Planctomycetia bacterium]
MRRLGFTLVELVVVIGIVALLMAMILPAVQQARESSLRVHCAINLRQLGMAINAYTEVHGILPPTSLPTGISKDGKPYSGNYSSVHGYLLPFCEASQIFDQINFDFIELEEPDYPLEVNKTARQVRIAMFLCPSDPSPLGLNNYRVNGLHFPPWNFPFRYFRPVMPAAVLDGMGNTVFLSERTRGSFNETVADVATDMIEPNEHPPLTGNFVAFRRNICQSSTDFQWMTYGGRFWFFSGGIHTAYSHHSPPNDIYVSCAMGQHGNESMAGPRSRHPGGVNVLFGDGKVEFVGDDVDQAVWEELGTAYGDDHVM